MTRAHKFAIQVCANINPTQLLSSHNQIMATLTELQNNQLHDIGPHKTQFAFTDEHTEAMAQIQKLLPYLHKTGVVE